MILPALPALQFQDFEQILLVIRSSTIAELRNSARAAVIASLVRSSRQTATPKSVQKCSILVHGCRCENRAESRRMRSLYRSQRNGLFESSCWRIAPLARREQIA